MRGTDDLTSLVPALLFLCAGVPLAALLDRLGFFDAVAAELERRWDPLPVAALWWLAAATTVVLNLDTTVVLLTPLYARLAVRRGLDPLPLVAIPLLLASLASSALPVSNLTTLIATERYHLGVGEVLAHLAPVSLAASLVGWLCYRRLHPTALHGAAGDPPDRRALRIGSLVVTGLLVGFVLGPFAGVPAWAVALVADLVLIAITRWVPWRQVPVATAAGVATVALVAAWLLPPDLLAPLLGGESPAALVAIATAGTLAANAINNLPALLIALDSSPRMTPGLWSWLAGVNTGAVLLPLGALANLLWWRIVRAEGVDLNVRSYGRLVLPIALPALAAGLVALAVGA